MALWRCPHCGTPQPVASRCWVCRRSSTSCGTCKHFRTSVAARIGFCGLDRERLPLDGAEVRSCWIGRPLVLEDEPLAVAVATTVPPAATGRYFSGFVPVDAATGRLPIVPVAEEEPARLTPPPDPAPAADRRDPTADGLFWADLEA
jgi:hypothetical protein